MILCQSFPDSPLNQFEITTGAFRIWSIILRHSAAQLARTIRNDSIVKAAAIKDMLSFITDNYAQQITLADIAAAGKVSKAYCNRLFHKFTNRTPMEKTLPGTGFLWYPECCQIRSTRSLR